MDSLSEAFAAVESRRKHLEVYTPDDEVWAELETQFSTRNARVTRHPAPVGIDPGFLVVRSADGDFRGALGIEQLRAIVSPEIHPPWDLSSSDVDTADLLDFLENTLFASYDRRQMLAMAREIEERAWRADDGTLYTGFQRARAFAAQTPVYERFARDTGVAVRIFVADEWDVPVDEAIDVVSESDGELGQFWFVLFDGGGSDLRACGLLAEERDPDRFYGFWTYDPDLVDELVSYLRTTYGVE